MELLLIRHARPRRVERAQGRADPGLDPLGRRQARALADWLVDEAPTALYVSPLRRAVETALPLAETCALEARAHEGVAEWNRDDPVYIPVEELRAEAHPAWTAMRDGRWDELGVDAAAFRDRVTTALDGIAAAHPGERVAVVCHAGVINAYTAEVLGLGRLLWFEPAYTSITRVLVDRSGRRSVHSVNESAHLRGVAAPPET
jgi:probable phosphoglycerate mutase